MQKKKAGAAKEKKKRLEEGLEDLREWRETADSALPIWTARVASLFSTDLLLPGHVVVSWKVG